MTTLGVGGSKYISTAAASQDDLYGNAADRDGSSLEGFTSAYEADPEQRRDLSQDIHFQLSRSIQRYDARCSLGTWVNRVAHHVAARSQPPIAPNVKFTENSAAMKLGDGL